MIDKLNVDDNQRDIDRSSLISSTNKNDSPKIDREELQRQVANKIDAQNSVDHLFTTTAEEQIPNPIGRLPLSCHIAGQDKASSIFVNIGKCTKNTLYATSSVSGVTARFILA